jgi:hypothetical protein
LTVLPGLPHATRALLRLVGGGRLRPRFRRFVEDNDEDATFLDLE